MNMDALPRLPVRTKDSHKGTYGTVVVVGGCDEGGSGVRMVGAPVLAARGALRTGAGLVKLVMPGSILSAGLSMCASATGVAIGEGARAHEVAEVMDGAMAGADVIAIGCGLGTYERGMSAVFRAIQQDQVPLVIDADGLNCLSRTPEFFRDLRAPAVLTPHPGEFKRLCESMGLSSHLGLASSREGACQQMAQRLGRVVVLKGAGTVVSDGLRVWTCERGHPCMATAGTGDVLCGVIAALIGQFVPSAEAQEMRRLAQKKIASGSMPRDVERPLELFDAARLGVEIHARAGENWSRRCGASAGLLAEELADEVSGVIEGMRG